MDKSKYSIGFFDSGIGGLSVLREALKILPNENYIYYGDSIHAPYGTKSSEEVRKLSFDVVDKLIEMQVKAIVVACNTATSIVIDDIRRKYKNIPIIGIEPALKPAVEHHGDGTIVIMATPVTLSENKFMKLRQKYSRTSKILSMPCPGLAEIIESGELEGEEVEAYLKDKFKDIDVSEISSIVLGCTHYPFIKNSLLKVVGENVAIIDGSLGTVKQLKRMLEKAKLINDGEDGGKVEIINSSNSEYLIDLSYQLLKKEF